MIPPGEPKLPQVPDSIDFRNFAPFLFFMRSLVGALKAELQRRAPKDTAVDSVLLISPSSKVFKVTVADDGTISTVQVGVA